MITDAITKTPFTEKELMPKEEKLEILKKRKKLSIGIPREICSNERRLCLTPDAVNVLVHEGHTVFLESGAGKGSFFSDTQYLDVGAKVTSETREVFAQDLILKINPPEVHEIGYLQHESYLISALQINLRNKEYFTKLSEKKVNAIAFELIRDEYEKLPLIRLIGEIAGTVSILYASELLSKFNGLMLGGITGIRPSEVVILGAGTVGEFATKAAIGLGACVRIFDSSFSRIQRLHSTINKRVPTSLIDPKELKKCLRRTDILIGALSGKTEKCPVTEDMVILMKKGSVIIDITTDQGKCVETSEVTTQEKPFITKHDVIHCGLPNLTSLVPRTATKAISNFFSSYLLSFEADDGFENMLLKKKGMKESLYMYKGRLTNENIASKLGLQYNDINLLLF